MQPPSAIDANAAASGEDTGTAVSRQAACVGLAEARLMELTLKLAGVTQRIREAVDSGRIQMSDQLDRSARQAHSDRTVARQSLDALKDAQGDAWFARRADVHNALDHLAQSIQRLVGRFS